MMSTQSAGFKFYNEAVKIYNWISHEPVKIYDWNLHEPLELYN